MKELFCKKCNKLMAKMETGTLIRNGAVILCKECMNFYDTIDAANKAKDVVKGMNSDNENTMDFLKGLFQNKK